MNPELETLKAIERLLTDTIALGQKKEVRHELFQGTEWTIEAKDAGKILNSFVSALTIIKDRKATIEEKEFNDPNYYEIP